MDAVRPHFDHHEEVPGPRLEEMFRHGKPLRGHLINLTKQPFFLVGAKALDVNHVIPNQALHLWTEGVRIGVLALGSGSQKTTDQMAAQRLYRISRGRPDDDGFFTFAAENIPDRLFRDARRVRQRELAVAVLAAVAEAVNSQLPGIPASYHAHPGWHSDRRGNAAQFPMSPCIEDALDIRKVIEPGA